MACLFVHQRRLMDSSLLLARRSGRSKSARLPQWPKDGPPLAWEAKGLGSGYSAISSADGRIYTLGGQIGQTMLIALDMSGKKLWSAKVGTGDVGGGNYPGPRSTPTIDGDRVYA